jgi:regulation of enolase protein 1 (concanavalin A-like superfamily)
MPAEMTEKEKRAIEIFQSNRGDHKGNEAWVRHYLYMDRALDAKRLGSRLANDGFRIKVKRSGDGEKWLVLVFPRFPSADRRWRGPARCDPRPHR